MSLLQVSRKILPPRIVLYGVAGVGKTALAASTENPVFILTEDGIGSIEVPCFPLAQRFSDVSEAIECLINEENEFKTLVIDSLDWLEPMVWQEVARSNNVKSVDDIGYGKGYKIAIDVWRYYLSLIDDLREKKGMTIIQIAHSTIRRFDSPEHDPYDRYDVKLHSAASALIQEHADCVLFSTYRTTTTSKDVGFNSSVTRAVGSGERIVRCQERPGFLAKNRYKMPLELPMDWNAISKFFEAKK